KIRQHSPDFVISLGSRGKVAAFSISTAIPVVLGAILSPDSSVLLALQQPSMLASTAFTPLRQPRLPDLTVSLTPAPEQLFNQLRNLAPNIRGVHVVYHKNDTELINDARAAAKRFGLNLTVHQAQDLKQSALAHSQLMANLKSETEALWLLQNPEVVDNHLILPMVLKTAWQRKFVVISNNFSHVKHGVLFTLYPDNYRLGKHLWQSGADLVIAAESPASTTLLKLPQLEWLQQTRLAVNIRTARHLGLKFSERQQRQFDLIFPRHGG
ncbi:MAG: hypothetical protein COA99_00540, partial [Moraxellaceae bacterium]